jgi:hypothetical protein
MCDPFSEQTYAINHRETMHLVDKYRKIEKLRRERRTQFGPNHRADRKQLQLRADHFAASREIARSGEILKDVAPTRNGCLTGYVASHGRLVGGSLWREVALFALLTLTRRNEGYII